MPQPYVVDEYGAIIRALSLISSPNHVWAMRGFLPDENGNARRDLNHYDPKNTLSTVAGMMNSPANPDSARGNAAPIGFTYGWRALYWYFVLHCMWSMCKKFFNDNSVPSKPIDENIKKIEKWCEKRLLILMSSSLRDFVTGTAASLDEHVTLLKKQPRRAGFDGAWRNYIDRNTFDSATRLDHHFQVAFRIALELCQSSVGCGVGRVVSTSAPGDSLHVHWI